MHHPNPLHIAGEHAYFTSVPGIASATSATGMPQSVLGGGPLHIHHPPNAGSPAAAANPRQPPGVGSGGGPSAAAAAAAADRQPQVPGPGPGPGSGPGPVGEHQVSIGGPQADPQPERYLVFDARSHVGQLFGADGAPVAVELRSLLRGNWHLTRGNGFARVSVSPRLAALSPPVDEPSSPEAENQLTFYRRNLFSVVGTVSLSEPAVSVVALPRDQNRSQSQNQNLAGDSPVVPGSASTSATAPEPVEAVELQLEVLSSSEKRRNVWLVNKRGVPCSQFTVTQTRSVHEWSKVRFSSATVNNGAPNNQPYFLVVVSLVARTVGGRTVPVSRAVSRPIVVRGRHPRFYRDRYAEQISLDPPAGGSSSALLADRAAARRRTSSTSTAEAIAETVPEHNDPAEETVNDPVHTAPFPFRQWPDGDDSGGTASAAGPHHDDRYEYYPIETAEGAVNAVYNPHFQHQSLRDPEPGQQRRRSTFYRPLDSL